MRISDWSSDVCSSDLRSHYRSDLPGAELGVAEADRLGLRWRAAGDLEAPVEDLLADLHHGLLAVADAAAVDVPVLGHAAVSGGVGGELNGRGGLEAEYRSPSGGEAYAVRAGGRKHGRAT